MTLRVTILLGVVLLTLTACGSAETVIPYEDIPTEGDAERGAVLFEQPGGVMSPCISCHVADAAAAPSLEGYGEIAGTRVEGQSAHEYTFYSIAEPAQYIVEGFGNAMYNKYDDNLSPQDIADLIAYTLEQ